MEKIRDIEFNASGVTIGDRQMILRDIYKRLIKLAKTTPPPNFLVGGDNPEACELEAFNGWLRTIDVKLMPESDNKVDKYAIKVMVYSRIKKGWVHLGYVPQKYKLDLVVKGRRGGIPLNEVLHPLVDKGYVKKVLITGLGSWSPYEEDGERRIIYFLKVTVTCNLP